MSSTPTRAALVPRPPRRQVRLRCRLRVGERELLGVTGNLSVNGIYVRLPKEPVSEAIDAGAKVQLRFLLPDDADPIDTAAEVVWTTQHDQDSVGRDVLGVGLKYATCPPRVAHRLATFVAEFRYTVLIADPDDATRDRMKAALSLDYDVREARSVEEALAALDAQEVAVLIARERPNVWSGLPLLRAISEKHPNLRLSRILISETNDAERIRELVNVGKVFHVLTQPFDTHDLLAIASRAVESYSLVVENERLTLELEAINERLRRENAYLRHRLTGIEGFENILGNSPELRRSLAELDRVRKTEATVHIQGETGTGKELVARALHLGSPRANGPFVVQNCAGMTESLLQSTLFGHQKGSFTGADRDRRGVFQEADGGTLFLDEIAELLPSVQASLLRVLQSGEIMPVGANRPVHVNVRVVSATHKDLWKEVQKGAFREDLYFRVVVIAVRLPALRDRKGDVPILAQHFLASLCERHGRRLPGFSLEAMRALEAYGWPGNVRELEHEIERLVLLAEDGHPIPLAFVSSHIRDGRSPARGGHDPNAVVVPSRLGYDEAVATLERALVERALRDSGGVVSRAAESLGIERSRLTKIKKRLGVGGDEA